MNFASPRIGLMIPKTWLLLHKRVKIHTDDMGVKDKILKTNALLVFLYFLELCYTAYVLGDKAGQSVTQVKYNI